MKSKGLFFIISIQIGVVIFLIFFTYQKSKKNSISVSPINRESLQQYPSGSLHYFYEPKPNTIETAQREWLSYSPTYHINSDSLNERYGYNTQKGKGIFRIITLGDSFTFGAYVNTEDNWTELLEDYLNKENTCGEIKKYEVINLGMDGYDLAYETERFIKRGEKYDPDLMIMLVTDFGRVTEHRISRSRTMPTLSIGQKEEYRKQGNHYPEMNMFDKELSHEVRVQYQSKSLDRLLSIYSKPLLMMNYSLDHSYDSEMTQLSSKYNSITLENMSLKRNDKRYILPDWHPNTEGHKKIMEEIMYFLKKNKLLPCK